MQQSMRQGALLLMIERKIPTKASNWSHLVKHMGNALDLRTFWGANFSYVKTWGLKINFFHTFYKI